MLSLNTEEFRKRLKYYLSCGEIIEISAKGKVLGSFHPHSTVSPTVQLSATPTVQKIERKIGTYEFCKKHFGAMKISCGCT